jgi:hypothetical protein
MAIDLTVRAGRSVRFPASFSEGGARFDPDSVSFKLASPSGVESDLDAVRDAQGVYHADWDTTGAEAGDWVCGVRIGDAVDYDEQTVRVLAARTTP